MFLRPGLEYRHAAVTIAPDFPFDVELAGARAEAWRLLAEAATDPLAPLRRLTLATIGGDGRPRARTVVLRKADAAKWRVRFHTDLRSSKIAEITEDPRVALSAWDREPRTQLRLEGVGRVHAGDDIARIAWVAVPEDARGFYAAGPSSFGSVGPEDAFAPEAGADGFRHFAVIDVAISTIEWLHLGGEHHRRALFERAGAMRWLTP